MRQCFRPEASKSVLLNHPCVWRASFPGTPPGRGCSTELEDRIMPDLLYEVNNHLARYVVSDYYSLKFVTFYDTRCRSMCNQLLQEQDYGMNSND